MDIRSEFFSQIIFKFVIVFLVELSRLRGVSPSVLAEDTELLREELRAAEAAARAGQQAWPVGRLVREPRLRLPLLLTCAMQAGQQTSGINAVSSTLMYTHSGISSITAFMPV